MNKYMVSVSCSWIEEVRANSMDEAIKKATKKYQYGRGHLPREYVEVTPEYEILHKNEKEQVD